MTQDRAAAEAALHGRAGRCRHRRPRQRPGQFEAGKQSEIEVLVDDVDPVDENYAAILGQTLASEVNSKIIEQAVGGGPGPRDRRRRTRMSRSIPPEVVAAPTTAELAQRRAVDAERSSSFFGPAVLALILQHLAVTLVALSFVRERTSGVMELFRISPVSAAEIMAGKIIAFGVLGERHRGDHGRAAGGRASASRSSRDPG